MTIREQTERIEKQTLSSFAALSSGSRGRVREEPQCPIRTVFQRDRDRVIHCKAFRRLKHNTQVFLSPEGDHYRTRLTHTLEVSQIARTIARALRMNEDLTEAIALAHDLGHTPFGHAGERALDDLYPGGFRHYEQSLRVVDIIEKDGEGLNLTYETRNGIVCHTKGKQANTTEGRIVRLADRIAYINHDIDDALRAGVLHDDEIPLDIRETLGSSTARRINTLVVSVIENTDSDILKMDEAVQDAFDRLYRFMFDTVYISDYAKLEEKKVPEFMKLMYSYFLRHPEKLPEENKLTARRESTERAVCDYLAGMTDNYALETFSTIFIPHSFSTNSGQ